MAQETERKFLVAGDFMPYATAAIPIAQGYLCTDPERTVRVRRAGDAAYLTIKSAPDECGWSRYEFEQPIPVDDAQELLSMCAGKAGHGARRQDGASRCRSVPRCPQRRHNAEGIGTIIQS